MINSAAFRMVWENATTVQVGVRLPDGNWVSIRVTEFETRITGIRSSTGETVRDIRLEWVTSIFAF